MGVRFRDGTIEVGSSGGGGDDGEYDSADEGDGLPSNDEVLVAGGEFLVLPHSSDADDDDGRSLIGFEGGGA